MPQAEGRQLTDRATEASIIIDILGWIILCRGGCPVHYKMFRSIHGLCLAQASSPVPCPVQLSWSKMSPNIAALPLGEGGQNPPWLRNTDLEALIFPGTLSDPAWDLELKGGFFFPQI